jgi:hypothetical protein
LRRALTCLRPRTPVTLAPGAAHPE